MSINIRKENARTKPKPDISVLVYGKVPPQAPELEEAVLGACLLERDTFEKAMEVISGHECYYVDAHQKIWQAMKELYNSGKMVDLLTVTEQLRKTNELELIGGMYYLSRLTSTVLSSAHVEAHARIVMEKFFQREVIRICGQAVSDAYEDSKDPFDLMDALEADVKGITASISNFEETHIGASYCEVIDRYNLQKSTKSDLIGLDTGFSDLNNITGGFKTPGLIIVAAYPSEGKTALMLELMRKIESRNKKGRCKAYSLETGSLSLTSRMAASENHIPFEALQKGQLNIYEEELLYKSTSRFNAKRISFSTKIFYIEDIEKSARKLKKKYPDLGVIFLDFIQLVRMRDPGRLDKYAIVGEVSRRLKLLSAELEVPIIILSQMNRAGKKNHGKRPELENLANSSELEQNADVVIFIWYKDSEEGKDPEPYLIIAKNKDGKTGDIRIKFDAEFQTWADYNRFDTGKLPSFVENNIKNASPQKDEDAPF